jgi:bifunctional DNA-binding transcriptional regulator/antitoxin component of YhaV-PrlF toxin-antitoxin module
MPRARANGRCWYSDGMRVAIDGVGRLVIPKRLRDELGVRGPTDLELTAVDGRLELTVTDVPARVEDRDGFPVIVAGEPMAPMSVAEAAEAVERVRR